ncbi:MAG: diadenylate cyclase CdaA [Phycisphaerae bacterium]|nr:diadenylate cyclase CdaA [Phycisphaerae bacterium]
METWESIVRRIQHPDWRLVSSAVELLLIGSVVYVVLRLLRGTRGERLLRGMALIVLIATLLVSVVADVLKLERIRVLYPPFVIGVVLATVVAFQPELRRALLRLGAARLFGNLSGEFDRLIDEVVDSAEYLSRNKIGAIIAFERSTELGPLAENGCKLDAEVSTSLLNTIFWPGSALHDMGVVISQGRVAAAAVQFPLTDTEGLDRSFGSRHRAAIGLTEETDAVVLVVSEETGVISLVERGKLHRFLTPETLRPLLRTLLTGEAGETVERASAAT